MRNVITPAVFTLAVGWSVPAWGVPQLFDPFNYTAGQSLEAQTNPSGAVWVKQGATTQTPPTIGTGSLSYPGLPASTGNNVALTNDFSASAKIPLPGSFDSGTVYYSLILQVADMAGIGAAATGSFFAGLNTTATGSTSGPTVAPAAMLIRRDPVNTSAFNIGTTLQAASGEARNFETTAHLQGETLFLVASYTFNDGSANDVASLWVNPDVSLFANNTPPTPTLTATGTDLTVPILSIFLRNNTVEPQQIFVDELRVGTAPMDAVPEPSTAALLAVSTLIAFRRRRAETC